MSHTYGQTGAGTYGQTYGQTATQTDGHGRGLHVLDDRDILTDLLLCSKQLLHQYGTAAVESTNPQLRQTLQQIAQTEAEFHKKAFEMMQQRGWYQTPRTDSQLAKQIASVWTEQMQRGGESNRQHYPTAASASSATTPYGGQAPTQSWQPARPGDGSAWQHGWSGAGQGAESWSQAGTGPWQAGQAAARPWEPGGGSGGPGTSSPGAHT